VSRHSDRRVQRLAPDLTPRDPVLHESIPPWRRRRTQPRGTPVPQALRRRVATVPRTRLYRDVAENSQSSSSPGGSTRGDFCGLRQMVHETVTNAFGVPRVSPAVSTPKGPDLCRKIGHLPSRAHMILWIRPRRQHNALCHASALGRRAFLCCLGGEKKGRCLRTAPSFRDAPLHLSPSPARGVGL